MQPARNSVVLAEEFGLLRDGIAAVCESSGRYRVVAATACGEEAWNLIVSHAPDLALIDFQSPRLHSLEIAKRLAEPLAGPRAYKTRCVILTSRTDRKTVIEVLRAGSQGFFVKSGTGKQLLDCLDQVLDGGIYVSPNVNVQSIFTPDGRAAADPLGSLSAREYQVFSLLVDGVRAKEIAGRLQVSPKTVDTYRANLMKKLNIHDVPGLVKFAIQQQLISS
ncbi:MAG: response regulator transcription factor [Acidobacteria bacterium]|nr:response regulator transcription factor [Acidobacteriota bacterium]